MSKINQIQNAIKELEGGTFQKLADCYLLKKGYTQINPLGSVIGSNKVRKGTPDTLIPLPNGKYIFAEYTTTQNDIFEKFNSDIDKCINENKTGISITKIEEIVLCHTSEFSTDELNKLIEKCQSVGANLNVFGMGAISYDLLEKYKGIAKDYLGIEVDTGQILIPEQFVEIYNKNKLATPLDTNFYFREDKINEILTNLKGNDLIIIAGAAGVGKSRLALECCYQFNQQNSDYKTYCIFNRGVDLFEDTRVYFSESGYFLIFVDDANRISGFQYILQILQSKREDQTFKIIVTVRDYALNKVENSSKAYADFSIIDIKPFTDEQIKKFIEQEYKILNHRYLERIADIAQGNPRLAVMAAIVACKKNTIESIYDVSNLYDEYYQSIREDLNDLNDSNLLKVAGIIAFFRSVDKTNIDSMEKIKSDFSINSDDFWQAAHTLHSMEIVDMYENEVVKTADQVLATYLLYLIFIKEKLIKFETLLIHFFPQNRQRIIETINPILNAFDSQLIMNEIEPAIDNIWNKLEANKNHKDLLELISIFWFVNQAKSLLYVAEQIEKIKPENIDIASLKFDGNSYGITSPLLKILKCFVHSDETNFKIALELVLSYLSKKQTDYRQIFEILTRYFGFQPDSYLYNFIVQRWVTEYLWEKTEKGNNDLFSNFFIAVAKNYLQIHHSTTSAGRGKSYTITKFDLPSAPEMKELREFIWDCLFNLYLKDNFQSNVLSILHNYQHLLYSHKASDEHIKTDAQVIIDFFNNNFSPENFYHCLIVQNFISWLDEYKVDFDIGLKAKFDSKTYQINSLLGLDYSDARTLNIEHEDFNNYKKNKIKDYINEYDAESFNDLFKISSGIKVHLNKNHPNTYHINIGINLIFILLYEVKSDIYLAVFNNYLKNTSELASPYFPVLGLIKTIGAEQAYCILNASEYSNKPEWLLTYFMIIEPEDIKKSHIKDIYHLYKQAKIEQLPQNWDFLIKYHSIDNNIFINILKDLLVKVSKNPVHSYIFYNLLNAHSDVGKQIKLFFKDNIEVLEQAYILCELHSNQHQDYNGHVFSQILDIDINFTEKYINSLYKGKDFLSEHDTSHKYDFIWNRDDYKEVMLHLTNAIFKNEKYYFAAYLKVFFTHTAKNKDIVCQRQNDFLLELIKHRNNEIKFMQFIFCVIASFLVDRRILFIKEFIKHNHKFSAFKKLSLEPSSRSWSGSAVPMYQKSIEFFESLLPLFDSVSFLQHKQYIEQEIKYFRAIIVREQKRDFMEDYLE